MYELSPLRFACLPLIHILGVDGSVGCVYSIHISGDGQSWAGPNSRIRPGMSRPGSGRTVGLSRKGPGDHVQSSTSSNCQCESLFSLGGPGRCRCDVLTQASIRGFARHRESDSLAGCSCFRRFLPRCADAWTGFRTSVAG